jgi:hypothetical protein
MAMRFAYTSFPMANPVVSFGGRTSRPWAMVHASVSGPTGTKPIYVKVDPGSDESLLDIKVAGAIGIDLSCAPSCTFGGIVQGGYIARFAEVELRLTDGIEFRRWTGWVGFVPNLRRPVLGFGGCLQFFKTTFFGDIEEFELEVNSLYQGT